jgi:hypothetical protein
LEADVLHILPILVLVGAIHFLWIMFAVAIIAYVLGTIFGLRPPDSGVRYVKPEPAPKLPRNEWNKLCLQTLPWCEKFTSDNPR